MKNIQMVDLIGQYQPIAEQIKSAFDHILNNASFINGADVKLFCQELAEFLAVKHVIPCANGTDALQIALMAYDFEPGDEIILPNFTYIATAEVIALLRLTPVYVDIDPLTFNINPSLIESHITSRTKAIMPVHLFGQCADMAPIMAIAQKHHLVVIEDNAQAIAAQYTAPNGLVAFSGTIGNCGTTSFYPSKNLSCYGDGGAMFTNDDSLAAKLQSIANHGQKRRYYFDYVGVNSRLDTLQAAVLRAKLAHLNTYTQNRQAAADFYDQALSGIEGITIPYRAPHSTHVFHQYTIRVRDGRRDAVQAYLTENNIPSVIFYPLPVHHQVAYQRPDLTDAAFPESTKAAQEVLSLPMHTELAQDQLTYIVEHIRKFFA
jgi:UDP-2-acetamido-2-deoxy-ribo-hexuluronate aminotransferase